MDTQATLTWTNGLQFVGRAENGPAVVLDTFESGGGPTPMQLLLMGIAGCTGMDVVSILKKKRMPVDAFKVTVSGTQAEEHPRRFTHIHIEYVATGQGITPKAMERAIELSISKYCSAVASISASIDHSYRIVTGDGAV